MSKRVDLARLLERSPLERVVPRLRAETLHQLIQYRGLEASGDLLAAATREQLSSVLDLDLWRRAEPAGDERFDPGRFGEWLETLAETGGDAAARVVSGMDQRLVIAGLAGHIRVFDPAARAAFGGMDDEGMDGVSRPFEGLAAEVGGYLVAARRADAWDAIVAVLLELEAGHREFFASVMRGCRRLSDSKPEADGFHDLPSAPGQLLHDLGAARQARRSRQGYLSPSDARLVLQIARTPPPDTRAAAFSIERIAADCLRGVDESGEEGQAGEPVHEPPAPAASATTIDRSIDAVVDLLAEAGLVPERPRALLEGGAGGEASGLERMRALMGHLHAADEAGYAARGRELAFLANALMAGCSVQARPFTPREASDAAVAVCNLGLEEWQPGPPPGSFVGSRGLIPVFQRGWSALHEMSLSAADRLVAILKELRCADVETQAGLHTLGRELAKHRAAGAPWRARDALDVVAILDLPAWVSLLGVLDECPILPAALRATLERRAGAISATAFEFVSTRRQVGEVRAFMERLPDVLLR